MSESPSAASPIGVISIGSNDLHLLVAESDGVSRFVVRADHALLVELAASLDGHLLPVSALNAALSGLQTLMELAHAAGASAVTAIATEAMREAANGPTLLALAEATFGISATVITGEQEAGLDYCWALFPWMPSAGPVDSAGSAEAVQAPPPANLKRLVIDSGGGSTQVVLGAQAKPAWAVSLPIGAGSLTAHAITHDPLKRKELQTLAVQVSAHVDQLPRPLAPESAIVMGGSADHLIKLTARPGRGLLTQADLEGALEVLHQRPAMKVARDYDLPIERVRLLPAGATILLHVMRHYAVDAAQVKAHGIRGGFIVCTARAGAQWLQACPTPGGVTARAKR